MIFKPIQYCLVLAASCALLTTSTASARNPIRVGLADESPAMFTSPAYQALGIKRTRYFVPSDVMQNRVELAKATAFVTAARAAGASTLLHISTTDLREKKGKLVSTKTYRRNVAKIVKTFRKLGVRDFGAWDEVNHKTQETWNHVGNAVSYFKSMWSAVHKRCAKCNVVGLDVLDQAGVDRYISSFYKRLSKTWRKRLKVVGIHNYSDVNRGRSKGTSLIIKTVHKYNRSTRFWFTETGALASFKGSFPYSESRQASRLKNMFSLAKKFRKSGVARVYSYNWFGIENGPSCGSNCLFDSGLVSSSGALRPAYAVFKSKLAGFSR